MYLPSLLGFRFLVVGVCDRGFWGFVCRKKGGWILGFAVWRVLEMVGSEVWVAGCWSDSVYGGRSEGNFESRPCYAVVKTV